MRAEVRRLLGIRVFLGFSLLIWVLPALFAAEPSCLVTAREANFSPVSAAEFYDVVSKLQNMPFLRRRSLEEYEKIVAEGGRLYLLGGGLMGYGITASGLLLSVFNDTGIRGQGAVAVRDAIQKGATSLICIDGPLRDFYGSFGFKVVEEREMRPENAGWDFPWPEGLRPQMLYMRL